MTDLYGYTAQKPPLAETSDDLRARIPGWGADLDPHDRPSVPKLQLYPQRTGAHWDFPERQPEHGSRERSIEHRFLTPVFGTAQPRKGFSGVLRKVAYDRYSEGRAAHWLLLLAADRVDTVESALGSFASGRPVNVVTETGLRSELSGHGVSSRVGQKRADVVHHTLDPVIVAGPWLVAGFVAYKGLSRGLGALRR